MLDHADHRSAVGASGRGDHFTLLPFYRIAVFELVIPPLRERAGDLVRLAEAILADQTPLDGHPYELSTAAAEALERHPWPGNIRELQNALQRAVVVASSHRLELEDLPIRILSEPTAEASETTSIPARAETSTNGPNSSLGEIERDAIRRVIDECNNNLSEAARRLDIGRTTLYRKLLKYDLR